MPQLLSLYARYVYSVFASSVGRLKTKFDGPAVQLPSPPDRLPPLYHQLPVRLCGVSVAALLVTLVTLKVGPEPDAWVVNLAVSMRSAEAQFALEYALYSYCVFASRPVRVAVVPDATAVQSPSVPDSFPPLYHHPPV